MDDLARWARAIALLVALVVPAGCDDGSGTTAGQVWDSLDVPTLDLASEPEVVIGDRDEDPAHLLHLPTGALRLSDGRIVLADAQSREVRFFSPDGEHLHTVGGEGEGPGEFLSLFGLHRSTGDTVVAWDRRQRRATRIAPDGSVVEVVSVRLSPEDVGLEAEVILTIQDVHPMASGALVLALLAEPVPGRPGQTDLVHDTVPVIVYHPGSDEVTLLGTFPNVIWFRHDQMVRRLAFAPGLSLAASREVIHVGTQRSDSIRRFTDRGEPLAPTRVPLLQRPVTPEDAAWLRERAVERVVPEARERARAMQDAETLPDSMPAYDRLRIDADERLWIRRAAGADRAVRQWVVLGSDGTPEARVLVPDGYEVLDAGAEYVVVHVTGEFDVDLIQLHRLEPGGTGPRSAVPRVLMAPASARK